MQLASLSVSSLLHKWLDLDFSLHISDPQIKGKENAAKQTGFGIMKQPFLKYANIHTWLDIYILNMQIFYV